jgi:hypothetical protein
MSEIFGKPEEGVHEEGEPGFVNETQPSAPSI